MKDLFDLGFVSFEINKAMLAKYNNSVETVAGLLCENQLSDSAISSVFK